MTLISLIDMKLVSLEGRHGPFLQVFLCLIPFLVMYLVLIAHAHTGLLILWD